MEIDESKSPRCVRLQIITMHTCTIFWLICVVLMAPFRCIRSMYHR